MNGKGEVIPDEDKCYIWMDNYKSYNHDDMTKNEFKVEVTKERNFSWKEFLDAAVPVFNENLYQCLMMLAGSIACFHYPYAIEIAGKSKQQNLAKWVESYSSLGINCIWQGCDLYCRLKIFFYTSF